LARAQLGDEVEGLEDETDAAIAHPRQGIFVEVFHGAPVEQVATGVGNVQQADEIHEGGLAGTGRPGDGDELAARDLQVDAAQDLHPPAGHGVALADALQADHGLNRGPRS